MWLVCLLMAKHGKKYYLMKFLKLNADYNWTLCIGGGTSFICLELYVLIDVILRLTVSNGVSKFISLL